MLVFASCVTLQQFNKVVICHIEWRIRRWKAKILNEGISMETDIQKPQLGPIYRRNRFKSSDRKVFFPLHAEISEFMPGSQHKQNIGECVLEENLNRFIVLRILKKKKIKNSN